MNEESCFNAKKAIQLGFADGMLYDDEGKSQPVMYSRMAVMNSLLTKLPQRPEPQDCSALSLEISNMNVQI